MQRTEYRTIGVLCKMQLVCKSVLMWVGEYYVFVSDSDILYVIVIVNVVLHNGFRVVKM